MSKKKIRSDFNRLKCGKTELIFAAKWSFNKRADVSSAVEEWFCPVDLNLEKNKSNDADTLTIHNTGTATCLHFLL